MFVQIKIKRGDFQLLLKLPFPIHKCPRRRDASMRYAKSLRRWRGKHSNWRTQKTPPQLATDLMRKNHTLKPHDSRMIAMNLNQMEQVENFAQEIEDKVKSDLQSSNLANGKIKAGRRTSYKFDEDVISEVRQLKAKLVLHKIKVNWPWKKSLESLSGRFWSLQEKIAIKKQNKHRGAKRKARYTSQRTIRSYEEDRSWIRRGLSLLKYSYYKRGKAQG